MSSVSEEVALAEEKLERAENVKKVEEILNNERLTRVSEAIFAAEDDNAEREKSGALADAAMDAEKNRRLAELEAEKIIAESAAEVERKENQAGVKKAVDAERKRQIEEWNAGAESEAEARKNGIALAIELEEKEQQRRIIEAEEEKLENMQTEVFERLKNQEAAVRAMEQERIRRISEDPSAVTHVKNSPHVRRRSFVLAIDPEKADEMTDEEERLKSGVVADAAAATEKELRILREAVETKMEAVESDAIRKLNQGIADHSVAEERKRRLAEEVAEKEEEKKDREKNRQLVKQLEEEERERRVSEVNVENERVRRQSEAERRANQVLVTQQVEEERAERIRAAPAKLPSSPVVRALPIKV